MSVGLSDFVRSEKIFFIFILFYYLLNYPPRAHYLLIMIFYKIINCKYIS